MLLIAFSALTNAAVDAFSLSPAELARAAGIAKPLRRRQFIAGRRLLRRMLADACGGHAEDWVLEATAGAPPSVASRPDLCLSVSHSGEWVAAAVADRPVGIDIEALRARRDPERFARWVCSSAEWNDWRALEGPAADDALIAHWTRKEAWLKRDGGEVLLTRMHRIHAEPADMARAEVATWRLGDVAMLSLCAQDVAAVAIDPTPADRLEPQGWFSVAPCD